MTGYRTTYAVWELTLACNLGCVHCGSRAGQARAKELTTAEALDLVLQMSDAGIAEVTLIGGEAFLRRDWLEIVRAIRAAGMNCSLTTGGLGISAATALAMRESGIQQVSVSVDGLERTHDLLRGRQGSWREAMSAMRRLREAGLVVTCNSQVNRMSAPELVLLYEAIHEAGARAWQMALTVPMGRAAEQPELLLQPVELLEVFPVLAELAERSEKDGVAFMPGNNIGYYGPYERLLRRRQSVPGSEAIWDGCQAGLSSIGIEADGTIKGCPSLPTAAYGGGNIRERTLREILQTRALNLNGGMGTPEGAAHLWGYCATCEYAELCRGGCTWTAHVFFGEAGNNPYCHHRALAQQRRGVRERLVQIGSAEGLPFDHGEFRIVEESADADWPVGVRERFRFQHMLRERSNVSAAALLHVLR